MSLFSTKRRILIFGIATLMVLMLNDERIFADLSTLARNDPYPVYTAIDPQEFLYTWQKLHMKGIPTETPPIPLDGCQFMSVSISPFGQNACGGKNFGGDKVPLGDLNGRWNMIGLLMGPLPQGIASLPPALAEAFANLFPGFSEGTLNDPNIIDPNRTFGFFSVPLDYKKRGLRWEFSAMLGCDVGFMFQGGVADICQKVVAFDNLTCISCENPIPCNGPTPGTTPGNTQPTGTTAAVNTIPCNCPGTPMFFTNQNGLNVPISCCTRVCDVKIPCCGRFLPVTPVAGVTSPSTSGQCCPGTTNCPSCAQLQELYPNLNQNNVNQWLMNNLKPIADAIGLDICNFHKTAIEDFRFYLFWRRAHIVNKGRAGWSEFLFIPYLMVGGSIPTAPERNTNVAFSLPFGNNGHFSAGASGGFNIDFTETIEIGTDFGITGFFPKNFCNYRVPNRVPDKKCQGQIFPFTTNVRICPGFNWTFGAKMLAYHFIDRLSVWAQYLLLHHEEDKVTLRKPDSAFAPDVLQEMSSFKVQVANLGFYYDISPNVALGVFTQIPLNQRNAYRSTTLLFSLWGTW